MGELSIRYNEEVDLMRDMFAFEQAIAKNITTALEQFAPEDRSDAVILFSAHSLPLSVVK